MIINKETRAGFSTLSKASGMRWIIASPKSAPTARLTSKKILLPGYPLYSCLLLV
jgi:hypothetical protein